MKTPENDAARNRENHRNTTILFVVSLGLLLFVLFLIKKHYFNADFGVHELCDTIISGIIGILPPLIIFTIPYEYLSKNYNTRKTSESIFRTISGNTEILKSFREDTRHNFMENTLGTFIGDGKEKAIYEKIKKRIEEIKTSRHAFKCHVTICRNANGLSPIFPNDGYCCIKETITFTQTAPPDCSPENRIRVGFFRDHIMLDREFSNNEYVFRELLQINEAEFEKIRNLPDARDFAEKSLKLFLLIDNDPVKIEDVTIDDRGIDVLFECNEKYSLRRINIRLGFCLPQIRGRSEFFVTFSRATLDPEIELHYDSECMKVRTYRFLEGDTDTLRHSVASPDRVFIAPGGWHFPPSGVFFLLDTLENGERGGNCSV